ncbi:hypothetical protein Mnod_7394 [Methylobacterium nodulans ORS 2060]|uniref:Uncharacterized protein n=1 Tax=Methylobacterium nodulans (strain LMG 21967 / CNCM I-2342 / ORS 2060) TaxID=460265 RepID=B8IN15_METNO|nr:hypothetical protein Mnod_7394 [Methylobacterium nodulans ORS 2060]
MQAFLFALVLVAILVGLGVFSRHSGHHTAVRPHGDSSAP